MASDDIRRWTEYPEEVHVFQQERLVVEITELMCKIMKEHGVKRGELAQRLNKSKGRISQILNGETNPTLRTVADVFTALGKTLRVSADDLFVERPLLQCVGQVVAMPSCATSWKIEGVSIRPCGNLAMSG